MYPYNLTLPPHQFLGLLICTYVQYLIVLALSCYLVLNLELNSVFWELPLDTGRAAGG